MKNKKTCYFLYTNLLFPHTNEGRTVSQLLLLFFILTTSLQLSHMEPVNFVCFRSQCYTTVLTQQIRYYSCNQASKCCQVRSESQMCKENNLIYLTVQINIQVCCFPTPMCE